MGAGWISNISPRYLSPSSTIKSIAIIINVNMTIIDGYYYDYLFACFRTVGSFFLMWGLTKNFDHHGWPTTKSFKLTLAKAP